MATLCTHLDQQSSEQSLDTHNRHLHDGSSLPELLTSLDRVVEASEQGAADEAERDGAAEDGHEQHLPRR